MIAPIRYQDPESNLDKDKILIQQKLAAFNLFEKFSRVQLKISLLIYAFDPFLIYKSDFKYHESAKYRVFQSDKFNLMGKCKERQFVNFLTKLSKYWILYTSIKFILIGSIEFCRLNLLKNLRENSAKGLGIDTWSESHLASIEAIINLIGDPFRCNLEASVFSFLVTGITILYSAYIVPRGYSKHPMDCIILRMYLDPMREIKRIDYLVQEEIGLLKMHIRATYQGPFTCRIEPQDRDRNLDLENEASLVIEQRQRRQQKLRRFLLLVHKVARSPEDLRPYLYTSSWFIKFTKMNAYCASIGLPWCLISSLYMSKIYSEAFYQRNERFNLAQRITMIEHSINWLLIMIASLELAEMSITNTSGQLCAISSIRAELISALNLLIRNESRTSDDDLNISLIRSLIKIRASLIDMSTNANHLSQMFCMNVVLTSSAFPLLMILSSYQNSVLREIRPFILSTLWIWCNSTLLSCAYIYAAAVKLERIADSICARLIARQELECNVILEDPIQRAWQKLIMGRVFFDPRNCIRPFGFGITFQRVLQMNFLALSFSSLLQPFKINK